MTERSINQFRKFPNRQLWANYNIELPNFHKCRMVDVLYLPQDIELILDETYNLIHSRLSMSYVNIYMGHIAFELRKTDTNIKVATLQLRTIDVLYREEWDYRVYCERIPNNESDWHFWDFLYEVHDHRKDTSKQWVMKYQDAEKIFPFFNTKEIIKPRFLSRIEYEFLSSDPLLISLRSEDLYKKIKDNLITDTKYEIEYQLKRAGFDKIWTHDVFLEMKHQQIAA